MSILGRLAEIVEQVQIGAFRRPPVDIVVAGPAILATQRMLDRPVQADRVGRAMAQTETVERVEQGQAAFMALAQAEQHGTAAIDAGLSQHVEGAVHAIGPRGPLAADILAHAPDLLWRQGLDPDEHIG